MQKCLGIITNSQEFKFFILKYDFVSYHSLEFIFKKCYKLNITYSFFFMLVHLE